MNVSLKVVLSVLSLSLTLFSFDSWGLGKLGHKLVCQLSYQQLSLPEQQSVDALIAKIPTKHQAIIKKYNYVPKEQALTFSDTCSWADAIKRDDKYKQFKSWHYINVSRDSTEITAKTCQKNCVTQAINFHKKALKETTDPWEKVQALMFLGHWVGDIHQPMHVSFSSDFGGNKNKVSSEFSPKCSSLHWYWDECLLLSQEDKKYTKANELSLFKQLSEQLKTAPTASWQASNVYQWATESLTLSINPDFQYCTLEENGQCESLAEEVITLSPQYHKTFQPVIMQRVVQASVRLAHTISTHLYL